MRGMILLFITSTSLMFLLPFCNKSNDSPTIENIDYYSIAINKKSTKEFLDLGKITKAVKLEANDESIIGNVEAVIIDQNGDIYVGDFDSGKKVLRFNKDGKFLNSFGRPGQGPSEFTYLHRFDITSKNEVFLLDHYKLIKFDKNGKMLKESKLPYDVHDMKVIDDLIFLYILGYKYQPEKKTAIVILNSDFVPVGGFSPYEARLKKYQSLPGNAMAKNRDNLFFIDIYDLALNIYSTKERRLIRLKIPNENDQLDEIWKKRHLIENDRDEIAKRIHRFISIYAVEEKLFLWEHWQLKGIYNYWLLDLPKRKALVLTYPGPEYFANALFFDRIAGTYNKGIIGVYDDVEKFIKHKNEFPILEDISFSMEDNPILVFFEFNEI